jgi:acetylglutamate kinase
VDGVKDAAGNVLESLTAAEAANLIETGVATGGMQAKLEAAVSALRAGIKEIVIAPGALYEFLINCDMGTRIIG